MTSAAAIPPLLAPPSLGALFVEFFKVSLMGFGGGVVLAHRIAVERRQWMSEAEFADALTLCQFMPGPNVVGIAICVGAKTRGVIGAMTTFAGFAVFPCAIGFMLAMVLLGNAGTPAIQRILSGVSAAAAGLMLATGLRLLRPYRRDLRASIVAALAFVGLAVVKLPLLLVLAMLAPLSVAATLFTRARLS